MENSVRTDNSVRTTEKSTQTTEDIAPFSMVVPRAFTSPLALAGSRRQAGRRKRLSIFQLTPEIHLRYVEMSAEFVMFWAVGKESFHPVISKLSLTEFRTYVYRFRFLLVREHAQATSIESFSMTQLVGWLMRLELPPRPLNALEYCETVETFVYQCGTQDLPTTQCIMEFLGLSHFVPPPRRIDQM